MKYLVLLFVVFGGIWWIRQQRASELQQASTKKSELQVMVPCVHCGIHVPQDNAVRGSQGFYCGSTHRDSHES